MIARSKFSWTGALQMTMTGGDYCGPIKNDRKAIIDFTCSDKTEIYGIKEKQICVYEFSFGSKYACGVTDKCIPTI